MGGVVHGNGEEARGTNSLHIEPRTYTRADIVIAQTHQETRKHLAIVALETAEVSRFDGCISLHFLKGRDSGVYFITKSVSFS